MRYRRDVPRDTDLNEVARHIVEHLAGAVDPDDNPGDRHTEVRVKITNHLDNDPGIVSVVGEIDDRPNAPYLRPGFDPATNYPEITFQPYEEPENGCFADREALARFHAEEDR